MAQVGLPHNRHAACPGLGGLLGQTTATGGPRGRCLWYVIVAYLNSMLMSRTVQFTSGSTGDPKGVTVSNRALINNINKVCAFGC